MGVNLDGLKSSASALAEAVAELPIEQRVEVLNYARRELHKASPFCDEPVDLVEWVKMDSVVANDYNPNSVAPPEMALLQRSIEADGYTQPIVTWPRDDGKREVVDGFHRNRVARECPAVLARVSGYLPVVRIRPGQADQNNRVASTIRHNRARGKHAVGLMAEIVSDLVKRNWSDAKIAKELGMDPDEVLRLKQVTGLAELFSDREFSEAWEVVSD